MEFKIVNADGEMKDHYKKVIKKYNGEQIEWFDKYCRKRDIFKIKFNSISDLILFKNEIGKEIIISDGHENIGVVLEIYDWYR